MQATYVTAVIAVLGLAPWAVGCEPPAPAEPRAAYDADVAERRDARPDTIGDDYAGIGDRTVNQPIEGHGARDAGTGDASGPRIDDARDALSDYLTARQSCEALERGAAQSRCLDEAREAYRRLTGRDPEAALPPSER
jgi:hypothetical protein